MTGPLQIESAEQAPGPELPYRLELWDAAGERIEALLATTCSLSLGYGCYYGALREFVGRRIVLRGHGKVIAASEPQGS